MLLAVNSDLLLGQPVIYYCLEKSLSQVSVGPAVERAHPARTVNMSIADVGGAAIIIGPDIVVIHLMITALRGPIDIIILQATSLVASVDYGRHLREKVSVL